MLIVRRCRTSGVEILMGEAYGIWRFRGIILGVALARSYSMFKDDSLLNDLLTIFEASRGENCNPLK